MVDEDTDLAPRRDGPTPLARTVQKSWLSQAEAACTSPLLATLRRSALLGRRPGRDVVTVLHVPGELAAGHRGGRQARDSVKAGRTPKVISRAATIKERVLSSRVHGLALPSHPSHEVPSSSSSSCSFAAAAPVLRVQDPNCGVFYRL